MGQDCFAIGIGIIATPGACAADGPSLDDAVRALEKAIEDAEAQASRDCPQGSRCIGTAVPLGPPTCQTQQVAGRPICICTVTVTLTGHCGRPGASAEPQGGTVLEAEDLRKFFARVAELPELPKDPQGPCRMYRQQKGHGFHYPVCAGSCASGKCRTTVEVRRDRVTARCRCD